MVKTAERTSNIGTDLRKIDVALLQIDPSYQRALGPINVNRMVREFDPAALGVIEVSQRPNGDYIVLDGQHRVELCHRTGHREALCQVHTSLSTEREAALFLKLNFERAPSAKQKFAARVVSKEPQVKTILAIADRVGFTVSPMSPQSTSNISAIAGLDKLFENEGGVGLENTLTVIQNAWPRLTTGREREMLLGIALFLKKYPAVKIWTLAEKLSRVAPGELHLRRKTFYTDYRCPHDEAMARAILAEYNVKMKSGRLPNRFDRQSEETDE